MIMELLLPHDKVEHTGSKNGCISVCSFVSDFFFLFYFESQFIERATVWLIQWQSYERFLVKKVMPLNQSSVDIYPPGTHDNRAIHMEFVGGFCSWEQKFEGGEVSAKERIIGHNMRDRS